MRVVHLVLFKRKLGTPRNLNTGSSQTFGTLPVKVAVQHLFLRKQTGRSHAKPAFESYPCSLLLSQAICALTTCALSGAVWGSKGMWLCSLDILTSVTQICSTTVLTSHRYVLKHPAALLMSACHLWPSLFKVQLCPTFLFTILALLWKLHLPSVIAQCLHIAGFRRDFVATATALYVLALQHWLCSTLTVWYPACTNSCACVQGSASHPT